jgi:N-acetyltransferase 10
VTCYLYDRQTTNDLTGEHSCIMLHLLDNSDSSEDSEADQAKKGSWLAEFWADFRRRFISLLGFQFRNFTPALALSVLQNKAWKQEPAG